MTIKDWISLLPLLVDLLKTAIPFVGIYFIIHLFKDELKQLIKNGGFKLSAPGVSIETAQQQQSEISEKEKKEIENLNSELENTKKAKQTLQELQEYTARDKDIYWLGYHLERTYRLIFPSQMAILQSAYFKGDIANAVAQSIFIRTIWFKQWGSTYEQFIGFLIGAGLLAYSDDAQNLLITPLGRVFVDYLTNNAIPNKLPATDFA